MKLQYSEQSWSQNWGRHSWQGMPVIHSGQDWSTSQPSSLTWMPIHGQRWPGNLVLLLDIPHGSYHLKWSLIFQKIQGDYLLQNSFLSWWLTWQIQLYHEPPHEPGDSTLRYRHPEPCDRIDGILLFLMGGCQNVTMISVFWQPSFVLYVAWSDGCLNQMHGLILWGLPVRGLLRHQLVSQWSLMIGLPLLPVMWAAVSHSAELILPSVTIELVPNCVSSGHPLHQSILSQVTTSCPLPTFLKLNELKEPNHLMPRRFPSQEPTRGNLNWMHQSIVTMFWMRCQSALWPEHWYVGQGASWLFQVINCHRLPLSDFESDSLVTWVNPLYLWQLLQTSQILYWHHRLLDSPRGLFPIILCLFSPFPLHQVSTVGWDVMWHVTVTERITWFHTWILQFPFPRVNNSSGCSVYPSR